MTGPNRFFLVVATLSCVLFAATHIVGPLPKVHHRRLRYRGARRTGRDILNIFSRQPRNDHEAKITLFNAQNPKPRRKPGPPSRGRFIYYDSNSDTYGTVSQAKPQKTARTGSNWLRRRRGGEYNF
jgi:hypothetical protein